MQWSQPLDPAQPPKATHLSSNQTSSVRPDLSYSTKDIQHVEEWVKRHVETTWHSLGVSTLSLVSLLPHPNSSPGPAQPMVAIVGSSQYLDCLSRAVSQAEIPHTPSFPKMKFSLLTIPPQTCSMAPRNGNSIVKHGVLDERLNVHGVKNLKVADLSICPDNVGCNTCTVSPLLNSQSYYYIPPPGPATSSDLFWKG